MLTVGLGAQTPRMAGRFPMSSTSPINYWSQNTAKIRFIGQQARWHGAAQGPENCPCLPSTPTMARKPLPCSTPRPSDTALRCSTWRCNRRGWTRMRSGGASKAAQPDWVILRSVGVMTTTALKEAAQIGFPRDKIVGQSYACAEQDTVPAGEAARGYICATWHAAGTHCPPHPASDRWTHFFV